jgi:uncharacterized metal-binding protein
MHQVVTDVAADPFARQVLAVAAGLPRQEDGALRTRVDETIAFCREMGFTTIGVAFCSLFSREARVLCALLSDQGFQVVPVNCKVGRVSLTDFGVETSCTRRETACNPATQAALMNARHTDLNIVLGLCVGHDVLFARHATGPITTLAVKDRALRHQPLEAMRPHATEAPT